MRQVRLKQLENAVPDSFREISAEEAKAYRAEVVALIMNVVERIPADAPPVTESFDELIQQLNNLTSPAVTVRRADGSYIQLKGNVND